MPTKRCIPDEDLIAAWYGTRTLPQIASDLGVRPYSIERTWARLKNAGLLPQETRWAHHLRPSDEEIRERERARHRASEKRRRDREAVHPSDTPDWQLTTGPNDPLLMKLYKVHREPRYDIAPQLQDGVRLRRTA